MEELRVFGPPGTGKSTWLATVAIPKAVDKYGSKKVVVTSFTRTAAYEISSKPSIKTGETINLPQENVGTLHALCFRLFQQPNLVYKEIDKWNALYPGYKLGGASPDMDNGGMVDEAGNTWGATLLLETDKLRNRMIPKESWGNEHVKFYQKWQDFKVANNLMDFVDLIERGIKELAYAPNQPEMIFVDEAQDFTRLQLTLIRSWGQQARWIVLVGDDDQTLYQFTGATPDAFLNPPIDEKHKRVLEQSYRVPGKVHERAMALVSRISRREPKVYKPTIVEGSVQKLTVPKTATFKAPGDLLQSDKCYEGIKSRLARGQRIMYLASCSYMLTPMIKLLKKEGIPFFNPYRITRGDWNPIRPSTDKSISTKDILLAFLSESEKDPPHWHVSKFVKWAKFVKCSPNKQGAIVKQAKAGIEALEQAVIENVPGLDTTREVAEQILHPEALEQALARDVDWLKKNLVSVRQRAIGFPIDVVSHHGIKMLDQQPQIIVGTIHSVKGGEADCVYLVPDISAKSKRQINDGGPDDHDAVLRMFYVGMTRSKEDLIILHNATPDFMVI